MHECSLEELPIIVYCEHVLIGENIKIGMALTFRSGEEALFGCRMPSKGAHSRTRTLYFFLLRESCDLER
jgi:hypothetical protein